MKAAFFTFPAAFQDIGGGEIQLLKTKEALEKEGVSVRCFDIWKDRLEDFDLLHIFSSSKECLGLAAVAKARRVKVVVSPILFTDFKRAFFEKARFLTKLDLLTRHFVKTVYPAFPSPRRSLLMTADLLCPNSEMERRYVHRHFAVPLSKMEVVFNGVSRDFLDADPAPFGKKYGKEPFVLSVGRIEPRKNQLGLIRAMKGIPGRRLVFIGSPVSGYEDYEACCRKEGEGFAIFIPYLDHGDVLLKSAYAACDLFVLQSFVESTGLVVLEAALAGAKTLVTQGGFTREYYKDYVDYLDPASVKDIQAKILSNLKAPKNDTLKKHVLENFTWDKIAKRQAQLYRGLVGDHA